MKKITVFLAPIVCLLFHLTATAAEKRTDCIPASQPVVSASSLNNCGLQLTTLSIASGNLNDSAHWAWYADNCGGTPIGTGTSLQVTPSATTSYYVRGEGGCATNGACGSITITVMPSLFSNNIQPFVLNGSSTAAEGNCYQLTHNLASEGGSAWYPSLIDLNYDFDFRFTLTQSGDADGMMFVLQNSGTQAISGVGSDLGYYHATNPGMFSQSLGVEFDIYDSDASFYDYNNGPHLAIVKNGDPFPVAPQYGIGLGSHPVRFTWNHVTQVFSVYYDNNTDPAASYTTDLINTVFGGNSKVYMGFTGATGGLVANQSFCVESLTSKQDLNIITDLTTPACGSAILSANASGSANYLWSTGATTPTITVTQPGTYSLTVSNNEGCSGTTSAAVMVKSAPNLSYNNVSGTYPAGEYMTLLPTVVGTPATTYSITPGLSAGLNFDTTTGSIYGQPHYAASTLYTVTGTNDCGTSTTTLTFGVQCTTASSPSGVIAMGNNINLCPGSSILLVAPTTQSFLWSNGETTQGINATVSGSYTVELTNSYGCKTVIGPKRVVFNASPNITYPNATTYPVGFPMTTAPQNAGGYPSKTVVSSTVADPDAYAYNLEADSSGNVYYGEAYTSSIKKLAPDGTITICGGEGNFPNVFDLSVDTAGNIYVSHNLDDQGGVIRKITPEGTVTTLYGNLGYIVGNARDTAGNLYYSDLDTYTIHKIAVNGTNTVLLSGTYSYSMYVDSSENLVLMDAIDRSIRKIAPNGLVTTFASGFRPGTIGIAPDSYGNIYVAGGNGSFNIKKVAPDGTVSILYNPGLLFRGIAVDASNNLYTTADSILKLALSPNYSITPALPTGMVLDGETGTISGTPTEVTGNTEYVIASQNSCGDNSTTLSFATIACPIIDNMQTQTFICGTTGSTSAVSVGISGASATYTWQYRVVTKTNANPGWITITSAHAAVYSNYNTETLGITKTATLPAVGTQYRVLVNGNAGCPALTSDTANLTIITTAKAGTISVPTTGVCLGSDLTFTVSNPAGTSLQWQSAPFSSATSPGTFTDIPGANNFTYTLTDAQLNSNRSYRVVVTNACNGTTATSATKTITVSPPSVAGTITGGGVVCSGSGGTVKVTGYTGKVQWEYSVDGVTFSNAPKAAVGQTQPFITSSTSSTAASYVLLAINSDCYLRAKITSGACSSAYTNVVAYTISTMASAGSVSPDNNTICSGNGVSLTLSDAAGTITWEKSTNFTLATPTWTATANHSTTMATGNLTVSTAYRAKVTIGGCSTVYSNLAVVNIVPKPMAKPIVKNTTSPTGNTVATALCATSNSKVLTAGAGTVGDIHWQHSSTSASAGFTDIAGATGNSYAIQFPNYINYNTNNGANYYRLRMTNSCGAEVFGTAVAVYFKACGNEGDGSLYLKSGEPFNVMGYPNPYADNFNLSVTGTSGNKISVTVYDMLGKLIESHELSPDEVAAFPIGKGYASGVYQIIVAQGAEVKALRMIKQ